MSGPARPVDLKPLYADIFERFAELNIEGAFVNGESLMLLQRGTGVGESAAIRYDLAEVTAWLAGRRPGALPACSVRSVDLGGADGIAFAFTDGAALADGSWVFSAVAEDRDDSYNDGPCVAAAIRICGSNDVVRSLELLEPTRKVEGIEARVVWHYGEARRPADRHRARWRSLASSSMQEARLNPHPFAASASSPPRAGTLGPASRWRARGGRPAKLVRIVVPFTPAPAWTSWRARSRRI